MPAPAGDVPAADGPSPDTRAPDYAERLTRLQQARWKQLLDVQAPYRHFLRRHARGRVLDIGCGTGRVLDHLRGRSVGVDHNPTSVAVARSRGLTAYTPDEFAASPDAVPGSYDTVVLAHVVEHLTPADGAALIRPYLDYLAPGGEVLLIVPQERGYASDATHVTFYDAAELAALLSELGAAPQWTRSFPLPRLAGRAFVYNETIALGRLAA